MNIPRVIYLDQNVVVDACECMRPSKSQGREEKRQIRFEIERCVEEGLAIFPYSEVHLSEAANVTDPESRAEQIRFWKNVSKGYRFHDARVIERSQLQTLFEARPIRFARQLAVHHSQLSFEEELPDPDPQAQNWGESFRGLAEYWANKRRNELCGNVHQAEVDAIVRLIWEDLFTLLRTGQIPFNRLFSKHNDLFTEVCEYLRERGSITVFEDACAWLKENARRIPSVLINVLGVEYIAEEYATDLRSRKKVENAELDHDFNDLEALSHWFPYADCAYTDRKMATTIFPRLRKAVSAKRHSFNLPHDRPTPLSSLPELLKFLQGLSASESAVSVDSELRNDHQSKKTLLYVLRKPELLTSREAVVTGNSTTAEILPGGGLRIDATNEETWKMIVNTFQQMEYYIPEDGKSAAIVAADWSLERPHVASMFLSLGTCLLKRDGLADRISAALADYSDEVREIDDGWVHDLARPLQAKRKRSASAA
jgi:hypothetical protein